MASLVSRLKPPPLSDARWLQAAVLLAYALAAREIFYFERTYAMLAACVAWAVALDLLLGFFYFDRLIFPLSALIIGLADSFLVDSRLTAFFLLVISLSILSKVFVTYRGRHFFNPANFGVVLAVQFLPNQVALVPHLFSGYIWPSVVFAALGLATALRARQMPVVLGWVGGFILMAALRSQFPGSNGWEAFGPLISTSMLLFMFHMLTDPGTTPRTAAMKVSFGVLAAIIDGVLRIAGIPHTPYYALFVIGALLPFIRNEEDRQTALRGAPPPPATEPTPANPAG